jgi:TPR repeat protein
MRRLLAALVLVLALGGTAVAGQFEDGLAAYEREQYATAFRLFESLAYQGDIRAQRAVGRSYYDGKGVPQNFEAALTWFRAAAGRGSTEAQLYLGIMYDDGDGVARDRVAAAKWYRKVADKDPSIASVWLRFDADQGSPEAQFALGLLYAKGLGVQQDYVQAYVWFSLAASKNVETAAEDRDQVVS